MKVSGRASLAGLGTILILAAGSSTSEPLWRPLLRTDASSYAAGGTISARVVNLGARDVGFGACPFVLERRDGGEWTPVPRPPFDCDGSLTGLYPGHSMTLRFDLDGALEPGTYRLVMWVLPRMTPPPAQLRSASFAVRQGDLIV